MPEGHAQLRAQQHFLNHEEVYTDLFVESTVAILNGLASEIAPVEVGRPLLTIPLCLLFSDTNNTIDRLIQTFVDDDLDKHNIMGDVSRQLYLNLCAASNQVPDTDHEAAPRAGCAQAACA